MGELGGFLKFHRVGFQKRDPGERVHDFKRYWELPSEDELRHQGARCMDCGVPFCHEGCPLGNLIPDWNDLVYRGRWREALDQLHATNNFPEFTGLVCPAPCESACVLAINSSPVTIEQIEYAIIERGWQEGWVYAEPPAERTGKTVAVIGSGPAGLAAAAQLNRAGHKVTVYERDESPGGLVRYGVPDAKLEKWIIDRRVKVLEDEGIRFQCNVDVGADVAASDLREGYDAVVVAIGSRVHRDIEIAGREADGVHFAMDYLYQRNRFVARQEGRTSRPAKHPITAEGKRVVVIGGGDTGMDCVSNALREGAADVVLLDVYGSPPDTGWNGQIQWPYPPRRTPSTYALEEGGERRWSSEVTRFVAEGGKLVAVEGRQVQGTSSRNITPVPGTEFREPADLALIAIGFSHPEHEGAVDQLGVDLDTRGNVKAGAYRTSTPGVFAAGDARIGQSLIVTAIAEGRKCARVVDAWLAGRPVPLGAGA